MENENGKKVKVSIDEKHIVFYSEKYARRARHKRNETEPVYLTLEEHIEAHFLTCFISLLILRILSMKTGGQFSEGKLIESLRKANVDLLKMNKYKGVYYDEVLKCIDDAMGTTTKRKCIFAILQEYKRCTANNQKYQSQQTEDYT